MKCLVLGARRYSFDGEDGGRVEGVTLHYLTDDQFPDENQKGQLPMQVSAPSEVFHQLSQLPGQYEIDFRQRPGRGGKPALACVGLEPVVESSNGADSAPPEK